MLITEHLMASIIVANANDRTKTTKFILVSIISGLLADLPVLVLGRPGEVEYLTHRIYTHSLLLWPLYSIIPAALVYLFFRSSSKNDVFYLYVISAVSFLAHILFDLLTPYGVQLFYPLSKSIYSFDLFHSFDPIFIIISSSFIGLFSYKVIRKEQFTRKILLTFIFIIISYTATTAILKIKSFDKYYSFLKDDNVAFKHSVIIPRTFWRWKLIAEDTDYYYIVFKKDGILTKKQYYKNKKMPKVIACSDEYSKFNDYARFPLLIVDGDSFDFINLIYSPKTYCLSFKIDEYNIIISTQITGFDFKDSY